MSGRRGPGATAVKSAWIRMWSSGSGSTAASSAAASSVRPVEQRPDVTGKCTVPCEPEHLRLSKRPADQLVAKATAAARAGPSDGSRDAVAVRCCAGWQPRQNVEHQPPDLSSERTAEVAAQGGDRPIPFVPAPDQPGRPARRQPSLGDRGPAIGGFEPAPGVRHRRRQPDLVEVGARCDQSGGVGEVRKQPGVGLVSVKALG